MEHEHDTVPVRHRQAGTARGATHAVRTLDEVADILGLSRQRVHDIETRAFKKIRHALAEQLPSLKLERDEHGCVCGLKEAEHGSPA